MIVGSGGSSGGVWPPDVALIAGEAAGGGFSGRPVCPGRASEAFGVLVGRLGRSGGGGQRANALERVGEVLAPGPAGGQVKRPLPG